MSSGYAVGTQMREPESTVAAQEKAYARLHDLEKKLEQAQKDRAYEVHRRIEAEGSKNMAKLPYKFDPGTYDPLSSYLQGSIDAMARVLEVIRAGTK